MNAIVWMAGAGVGSWLLSLLMLDRQTAMEVFAGMVGPMLVATTSLALADRTYRISPDRLTALMIMGFAFKLVFFGAYVIIMLRVIELRPVPFMTGFLCYFIGLHLAEAVVLRRLFSAQPFPALARR